MYFTSYPILAIYPPIISPPSSTLLIVNALRRSIQQYSLKFISQKQRQLQKKVELSEYILAQCFKENNKNTIQWNKQKKQKPVEIEFQKELEDLKTQIQNDIFTKQKAKRSSFLRAKTSIIEVLEALSNQQVEQQIEENQSEINYKNKSQSTIQDLKRTFNKQKKIQKSKKKKYLPKNKASTNIINIPTVSLIQTIKLPNWQIQNQQIFRKKLSLMERMVKVENKSQKSKTYTSRQKRQMNKLL